MAWVHAAFGTRLCIFRYTYPCSDVSDLCCLIYIFILCSFERDLCCDTSPVLFILAIYEAEWNTDALEDLYVLAC